MKQLSYVTLVNIDVSRVFGEVIFFEEKTFYDLPRVLSYRACACACGWLICGVSAYRGLFANRLI